MDSIERGVLDRKVEAWEWLEEVFGRLADRARAEVDRLWGPERGE